MKILLLSLLSLPLLSNDIEYIYLDCGQPKGVLEKQELLIKITPNKSMELLDGNLKWEKDNLQSVDLDSYFTQGPSNTYYTLERDTLKLKIRKYTYFYEYSCLIISEDKMQEEIDIIFNKKKSNRL